MVRRHPKHGRKPQFLSLPSRMITSDEFAQLSPRAVKLLVDLGAQYNGYNNGDLAMPWSLMSSRGWSSKDQLNKARAELLAAGFILLTSHGNFAHRSPTTYAITWRAIDETKNTVEVAPTKNAPNTWRGG